MSIYDRNKTRKIQWLRFGCNYDSISPNPLLVAPVKYLCQNVCILAEIKAIWWRRTMKSRLFIHVGCGVRRNFGLGQR